MKINISNVTTCLSVFSAPLSVFSSSLSVFSAYLSMFSASLSVFSASLFLLRVPPFCQFLLFSRFGISKFALFGMFAHLKKAGDGQYGQNHLKKITDMLSDVSLCIG